VNAAEATPADDFGADLRKALAVWSRQPLLPLLSVLWWTGPTAVPSADPIFVPLFVIVVLFLGWPGTEREWYRRAFAGEALRVSEIWPTTRRFFGPFLRLGLLASPFVVAYFVVFLAFGVGSAPAIAAFAVLAFAFGVTFTFVTPALTFTTPSARRAFDIGIAMLRAHWPGAAPYALTPAAVTAAEVVIAPLAGPSVILITTAVATLASLALKGATAAFYLRHPPEPTI
jgi:hypothetical protein